jgi:tripartite ATP-independent transporter DctP family solute receptor
MAYDHQPESETMKSKKWSYLATPLFAALLLSSCTGNASTADSEEVVPTTGSVETVSLRMASALEPSHPHLRCGAEPLAEWLNDEGTGIELTVFPSSQLGSDQEATEQVARGDLDLNITTFSTLSQYYAPLSVLDAAFVVRDSEHLQAVLDGEIGKTLTQAVLDESGIRLLGAPLFGSRHVTSNAPVTGPESLSGVKMRAIDEPLFLANARVLGANPTPIPIAELFLALQQGVVEAQENPVPTIASFDFMSVQSHISLTNHVTMSLAWVVNDQVFSKLTTEQQASLQAGVDLFSDKIRECVEADTEKYLEEWRADPNITVIEADEIDRDAFESIAKAVLPTEFSAEWGDLYQQIGAIK